MKTILPLLLCCAFVSPAIAQEKTPIPTFTGESLYVAGVPNTFEPLRDEIHRLEQSSPQAYYVAVVNSSGPGKDATKYYADQLYKDWLEQASRKGPRLDPDRAVIVVLAVTNKQLAVHAGVKLRKELGLSPERIDKDIVQPVFLPYAKAGNYLSGLQALLPAIEHFVVAREKDLGIHPPTKGVPTPKTTEGIPPVPVAKPETSRTEVQPQPIAEIPARKANLPLLIGLAAAGVALVLGIARLRHISTKRQVEARFKEFREQVMDLRQRAESVKERHQILPTVHKGFQTPMTGATLATFNQIDADVRRFMDDWLRRMDVWDRVQGHLGSASFFRTGPFREAGRLLDQLGSFEEVDKACQGCVASLDRLERAHEQAQVQLQKGQERTGQLRRQKDSLAGLGLAVAPYEGELTTCETSIANGTQLMPADPLGAIAAAEDAEKRMESLSSRMERVVQLFKRAPEVQAALDQVGRLAAERRAEGLRLTEPDGSPDPLLTEGQANHGLILASLQRGDPGTAAGHLDKALALAAEAKQRIERQIEARAVCLKEIAIRRSEVQRLRQIAGQVQNQRLELERSFAPQSWREVADHSTQAGELLASSAALLESAVEASSEDVQHYFRAVANLEKVKSEQEKAQQLLPEVGRCLQKLTEVRSDCEKRRQELADQARQAQGYLASQQAIVRQPAKAHLNGAEGHWQQARSLANSPRPDWPAVNKLLEEAKKEYTAALKSAEEDVRCYRQLGDRLADAERLGERVGTFLARHHEDRQQANLTYRSGVDALNRVRQEITQRQGDWAQLLKRVEEASANLTKAEELAQQDLKLADRASVEIDEADRQITRSRGYSEEGFSADLSKANQLIQQAHRHLGNQAYEQAIEQAKAAQQAAKQAYEEAANRVRHLQQQREAERRRLETAAAAAMTAHSLGNMNQHADAENPSFSPTPLAQTSWPSGNEGASFPSTQNAETEAAEAEKPSEAPPSESSQTSW